MRSPEPEDKRDEHRAELSASRSERKRIQSDNISSSRETVPLTRDKRLADYCSMLMAVRKGSLRAAPKGPFVEPLPVPKFLRRRALAFSRSRVHPQPEGATLRTG